MSSVEEIWFQKAKEQYDEQFDRKKTLEGKANNITTIAGTVATLLFGLGQLTVGKLIDLHYASLSQVVLILMIGTSLSVGAILFSVLGFRVLSFRFMLYEKATNQPSSKPEPSYLGTFQSSNEVDKVKELMVRYTNEYNKCIIFNTGKNDKKARLIGISQWLFFLSISSIPTLLLWLYLYRPV